MSSIQEVDVLKNWTLSIDHFYSIIKNALGEISSGGKYQIQATSIPLDINAEDYEWFSRGHLNLAFNVALEPKPVTDTLSGGLQIGTKLSDEYRGLLSKALKLVEIEELDEDDLEELDKLEVEIENLSEKEYRISTRLLKKWIAHCDATGTDRANITLQTHWLQGQADSYTLKQLREDQTLKVALQIAIRDRQYENPDHKALLDAYKKAVSPASTMRYPRFEDNTYPPEESAKFNVTYFASLPAHDSNLFINTYMMLPTVAVKTITDSTLGSLSSDITKESEASSKITTDWNYSGRVSYGPFKLRSRAESSTTIEDEFKTTTKMTISVKSLMAIPFEAGTWYTPNIFKNPIILRNLRMFDRWLGDEGTLHIVPTHLIVCRGFKVTFNNTQKWEYDYKKDFSAGGSAAGSIYGINFGGSGGYTRNEERQKVETRGHDLILDDGEENIRILGYHTVTNKALDDDWDTIHDAFVKADELAQTHARNSGVEL
ncbi:hypothetical protein [Desulforhopalus sp. 52FAK]